MVKQIALADDRGIMEMPTKINNLMTLAALGRMLGQSKRTMSTWNALGIIPAPCMKIKSWHYWHRQDILDWIDAGGPTREKWAMKKAMDKLRG